MHLAPRASSVKVSAPAHAVHRSPVRHAAGLVPPPAALAAARGGGERSRPVAAAARRARARRRGAPRCPDALRSEDAAARRGGRAADRRRRLPRARGPRAAGARSTASGPHDRARRAARPLRARRTAAGRDRITLWMLTAKRGQVVAYRTFLRTLLHELCHHLDYTLPASPRLPAHAGLLPARVEPASRRWARRTRAIRRRSGRADAPLRGRASGPRKG